VLVLNGQVKPVDRLAFSPDGVSLASAGGEHKPIEIWKLADPSHPSQRLPVWLHRDYQSFCYHPNGTILVAAVDTKVVGFDPATGDEAWRVEPEANFVIAGLDVTPDGSRLLVGFIYQYLSAAGYQIWEFAGRQPPVRLHTTVGSPNAMCRAVAFVPPGDQFVTAEDRPGRGRASVNLLTGSGQQVRLLNTRYSMVEQLAVATDGRFCVAHCGKSLLAWDLNAPKLVEVKVTNDTRYKFTGIAFHPSGRYLAATSNDATVKFYDTTSWEVAKTFTWDAGRMRSIAFSPDGTLAAAGSDTGKVVVWDVDL
jgi:WD40 repeat protein